LLSGVVPFEHTRTGRLIVLDRDRNEAVTLENHFTSATDLYHTGMDVGNRFAARGFTDSWLRNRRNSLKRNVLLRIVTAAAFLEACLFSLGFA
jgi:hypothetical protein